MPATKYTYDDLASLSVKEVRKIGAKFGLSLPMFGNMRNMILQVLRAQDDPVYAAAAAKKKKAASTSARKPAEGKTKSQLLAAPSSVRSFEELQQMTLSEMRVYARSLGITSIPRFGGTKTLLENILRAHKQGATPMRPLKSQETAVQKEKKGGGGAKNSSLKGKRRSELEAMPRSKLIAYGVSLGMEEDRLAKILSTTRIITDILLYCRDPEGFKERARAKKRAQAEALKCTGTPGGQISPAMTRGVSVENNFDLKETTAKLSKVPLLAKLKPDIIRLLAESARARRTNGGEPVFLQGEEGDGFYLIKKGQAEVIVGESTRVGALSDGDYFGEGALINKAPRGATVKALTDMICLFWTKDDFMKIFTKIYGSRNLRTVFAKRQNVVATSESKGEMMAPVDPKLYEKTEDERQQIRECVQKSVLLEHITNERHFNAILQGFFKKEAAKGHVVAKEGDPGLFLHVVQSGSLQVKTKAIGDVRVLSKGALIGEVALLHDSTNNETIVARTDTTLWCISRFSFRRLLKEVSEGEIAKRTAFLAQTDLCRALSSYERHTVAEALEQVEFKKGDVIVSQGDIGDCMYFLASGDVTAFVDGHEIEWKDKQLIGELALVSSAKRAATVKATEPTTLFRLSKLAVETLLGPVKQFLENRAKGYNRHTVVFPWGGTFGMRVFGTKVTKVDKGLQADRLGVQVGWKVVEVNRKPVDNFTEYQAAIDSNKENVLVFSGLDMKVKKETKATVFRYKLGDLKKMCILGKGSFGSVYLCTTKDSKTTYALKCVSKRIVIETKQSKHIVSEKQVMQKMNHPFIIKLFATYKDSKCIYFVLELCLGGELFGLVQNKGGALTEKATRFYSASIVSIFQYMHSMNIIYRDLKPENLLVDQHGFLKLVDFGFAKEVEGSTYTLCGTPDYLAPEIIRGTGHGKGVDWWCLGIFTYELVSSYAPFYSENPKYTYKMICSSAPITYPPSFSKPLKNLLNGLLKRRPSDRLGVIQGGADRIKQEEWFKGVDWAALDARKVKPPFVIPVRSRTDASNFDDYSDDEPAEDCGSRPTGRWEEHFG
uniref:cGMP-dependent protein kinase n=1 Tax=Lotharella globosa TaxID=91324 RepID=A0A7S3Z210_9EUKA|mmetsp:Transcript_19267/g.38974  ORF Transcript_19267/g.38974 Transcript_19267/m.38974 type:complete len:1059 (+) Transcript_19267:159-3335(+)